VLGDRETVILDDVICPADVMGILLEEDAGTKANPDTADMLARRIRVDFIIVVLWCIY